jgi:hypothetical protein
MGCCLLGAIVLGGWMALWERAHFWSRWIGAWLLRRPLPQAPASVSGGPMLSLGRYVKLFVLMEIAALGMLGLHELGGTPSEGGLLHALLHPSQAQQASPLCTAATTTVAPASKAPVGATTPR